MPPKKSNYSKKNAQVSPIPSRFKQDIAGILLIAVAIFIFIANLSASTGAIGVFLINRALGSIMGVGVHALPFFIGLYGIILLLRHEVKELAVRLSGLVIMFFVFITSAQFASPHYFSLQAKYPLVQGAGGAIGFAFRFALEKTIGLAGAYLLLGAFAFISCLLLFNVTFQSLLSLFASLLRVEGGAKLPVTGEKPTVVKSIPPLKQEVIPAPPVPLQTTAPLPITFASINDPVEQKPVVDFPLPKFDEEKPAKSKDGDGDSGAKKHSKYKLPSLDLLEDTTAKERQQAESLRESIETRKQLLESALRNFGVGARVVAILQGPAVTRYELQPEPGVKVSRIANLADDIALNLASQGVRIEAPVPGKSVVGIEVPNATVTPVRIKETAKTNEFIHAASKLLICIGKDLSGNPVYGDLGKMPHLLIAGTTGSGKSVCINALITSILLRARPDEVKMLMIDPKMVELSVYDGIAHLLAPVVTEPKRAANTLKQWVIKEMESRYKMFHDAGARNIESYNHKVGEEGKLPYILVIIDELADLMMVAANEVETAICRIAQLARATGIHLVLATQRPSVDVSTGLIKANIPSRIAFAVATQIDSRVVLDASGAEKLLGRGDMLYN